MLWVSRSYIVAARAFRKPAALLAFFLMTAASAGAVDPGTSIPMQPSRWPSLSGAETTGSARPGATIAPRALLPLKLPEHFENDPGTIESRLKQLVEETIASNPDLLAARYGAEAVGHRVRPAGMPDDPYFGYRMKDLPTTFSMTHDNATEKQIEFTQRYPFPGKLTLRQEAAGKEAEVARADVRIELLRVVTEVRLAFADIFVVDKDIQLALEQRRMLRQLRDIAVSKYQLGPGLQQDVINADVALAQLDTTLVDLTRKRETRLIRMAVLLNRPTVDIEPLGALPPASLRFATEQLEEMTLESNPQVERLGRAVERDTLNERLAARAPLPDMLLDLTYGSRNDNPGTTSRVHGKTVVTGAAVRPDLMTGQIMFDIPVFYFSKQREQLYEAQATLNRTRARLAAARDAALGALHDLLARLAEHEETARSYEREVIPLARSEVDAAISTYRVDKVDFLTLLAAQDNLEKYETAYWHNQADRYSDIAQIDEVTGAAINEAGAAR
jgi:outer membrane protein, heavy metal efflux system